METVPETAVVLERHDETFRVRTAGYLLDVKPGAPRVRLASLDDRTWSDLSLFASVDTVSAVDEAWEVSGVVVDESAHGVTVRLLARSSAWERREVILECRANELRLRVEVEGAGQLDAVTLLGGRAVLASGATGEFRSSLTAGGLFVPTPTEPVQSVRPSASPARIGVVGDAEPGRLHGVFSPPPLLIALGRGVEPSATGMPDGEWLALSVVAPVHELSFSELGYEPLDGGFLLRFQYDGRTRVDGVWTSPELVMRFATAPDAALRDYRDELTAAGWAGSAPAPVAWHREPIFCGWGAQCARAIDLSRAGLVSGAVAEGLVLPDGAGRAPDLARQELYDEWLATLEDSGVHPGTIVIDDRWQEHYGTNLPDTTKWPDLAAWIRGRHDRGQRVLLWFKAWDPSGLDPALCLCDPSGRPVAVDPGNPAYRAGLSRQIEWMLSPDGLGADGLKVDFTQRAPSSRMLVASPDSAADSGVWGVAALHLLLQTIHEAAHGAKQDALVIAHAIHPSFGDVVDMMRLNDVLERDTAGRPVPVDDQLRLRQSIARSVLPNHPIDTDQWPMPSRAGWLDYARAQSELGVPALYYVDAIDGSGERILPSDLREIAQLWTAYRARVRA